MSVENIYTTSTIERETISTTVDVETALRYPKYQQHIGHTTTVQRTNSGTLLTYCVTCATIIEVVGREEQF